MTSDDRLGEAKKWRTGTDRAGCSVVLREDGYEIASHIEHRTAELIVEAVNNYSALKQRVKVLEEALGKIEAATATDCWRLKYKGSCGCVGCIAREALNEGGTR